jgi:hypothetical protein
MPEKLSWTFAARVVGGPTISRSGDVEVEAYVKLRVTIKKGVTQDVEIFPGAGGSAQLVVITPAVPSDKLTYEVGSPATKVPLDGPHILIGSGAVGMLGTKVGTLKFDNKTAQDAEIEIIAGRDATP